MLKLLKECKKYSVSTYAQVEISLNTCRNTLDFMCDLELFSKIRSHFKKPGVRRPKAGAPGLKIDRYINIIYIIFIIVTILIKEMHIRLSSCFCRGHLSGKIYIIYFTYNFSYSGEISIKFLLILLNPDI